MSEIKTWREREIEAHGYVMASPAYNVPYMKSEIHELRTALQASEKDAENLLWKTDYIARLINENAKLRAAAIAVIDRWDTPHWKAVPATAEYIGLLRAALEETK